MPPSEALLTLGGAVTWSERMSFPPDEILSELEQYMLLWRTIDGLGPGRDYLLTHLWGERVCDLASERRTKRPRAYELASGARRRLRARLASYLAEPYPGWRRCHGCGNSAKARVCAWCAAGAVSPQMRERQRLAKQQRIAAMQAEEVARMKRQLLEERLRSFAQGAVVACVAWEGVDGTQ